VSNFEIFSQNYALNNRKLNSGRLRGKAVNLSEIGHSGETDKAIWPNTEKKPDVIHKIRST